MLLGEHEKKIFVLLDGMIHLQYQDEIRLLLQKGSREEKGINSEALLGHLLVASFTVVKSSWKSLQAGSSTA